MDKKSKITELFSQTNTKHLKKIQEKIELVNCPLKAMMCETHLITIYKSFLESEQFRAEKNFDKSIETLHSAFYKTNELLNHPCTRCANLYRLNIIDSLENIHGELKKLVKGIFANKRYYSSYLKADKILKELESEKLTNKFYVNEPKEKYLGNYLN
ncbi:MAG: hypothetical protein EP310_01700 [Bacteroidetes bacterium]|nr:MAG: hypothetical protein EP310_01700 [Bacteroidota bacterium]